MNSVSEIRQFNRFFAQMLGMYDRKFSDTSYSYTEARILEEIAFNKGITANRLVQTLAVDKGYLSRIISNFEAAGLVSRKDAKDDVRKKELSLTAKGKREFEKIDKSSDELIKKIIQNLSEQETSDVCGAMNKILSLLSKNEKVGPDGSPLYEIREAYDDIENVRNLFTEYTEFLGVNLSFQHYDDELRSLPGKYAKPDGRLFILYSSGKPAGCIALRKLNEHDCEIKRLFVRPEFRGHHYGRILMEKILAEAESAGYRYAYFDTLKTLESAVRMYDSMGAQRIPPYYNNPLEGVVYYRLAL